MNSPRARSSEASRRRIRSNARASWPTSSSRGSTIASSKFPAAMRSAACSSRRNRRAKRLAPAYPTRTANRVETPPAMSSRRRTTLTVWSCARSGEESRTTDVSTGAATSANFSPCRVTMPRASPRRLIGEQRDRVLLEIGRLLVEARIGDRLERPVVGHGEENGHTRVGHGSHLVHVERTQIELGRELR